MGKTAMSTGEHWHRSETVALRQALQDTQEKLRAKEVECAEAQHDLAEVHHRIANSLQLVVTFLQRQASSIPPSQVKDSLQSSIARVQAVARLHRQFQKRTSGTQLELGPYLATLLEDLAASTGARCTVHADGIAVDERLGLNLAIASNELIVNAAKYGAGEDGIADVAIKCWRDSRRNLCVEVQDQGPGFAEQHANRSSLGLSFVRAIVAQHKGNLLIENKGGTCVTMVVPPV